MFILIYYNNNLNVNALKAKFTWTQYKLIEIILRNTYSEYFKRKPFLNSDDLNPLIHV